MKVKCIKYQEINILENMQKIFENPDTLISKTLDERVNKIIQNIKRLSKETKVVASGINTASAYWINWAYNNNAIVNNNEVIARIAIIKAEEAYYQSLMKNL